jgi:hypothetical protein
MNHSQPFARAIAMMAAISAAMSLPRAMQRSALEQVGEYRSRGKGKGGGNRRAPGAHMAARRAAIKARNVRRHRVASRG